MNIRCLFGHKWERLTHWKPIKSSNPHSFGVTPKALFECSRCHKREIHKVYGSFSWRGSDEVTIEKALKQWDKALGGE